MRKDPVGGGGDPVATRGGHAAHGRDDRLSGQLHEFQFLADQFRGESAAAGGVDTEHERFHRIVLPRPANESHQIIHRRFAAVVPHLNGPAGEYQAYVPRLGWRRPERLQIGPVADSIEVVVIVPADRIGDV